jgi:hypothetical protein
MNLCKMYGTQHLTVSVTVLQRHTFTTSNVPYPKEKHGIPCPSPSAIQEIDPPPERMSCTRFAYNVLFNRVGWLKY